MARGNLAYDASLCVPGSYISRAWKCHRRDTPTTSKAVDATVREPVRPGQPIWTRYLVRVTTVNM